MQKVYKNKTKTITLKFRRKIRIKDKMVKITTKCANCQNKLIFKEKRLDY